MLLSIIKLVLEPVEIFAYVTEKKHNKDVWFSRKIFFSRLNSCVLFHEKSKVVPKALAPLQKKMQSKSTLSPAK